jgi:hypothetical protein
MVAITSLNSTNASASENINNNNISNLLINLKLNNPIQIKSQFKTIKVFVVSNKDGKKFTYRGYILNILNINLSI